MANENEKKFIILNDRYIKACKLVGIKPNKFYYEKGYVKCDAIGKAKRLYTFESKIVEPLEEKIKLSTVKKVVDISAVVHPKKIDKKEQTVNPKKTPWYVFWK